VGTLIDTSIFVAIECGELSLEAVVSREGVMAISAVTASELLHGVERASPMHRDKRQRFVEWVVTYLPTLPVLLATARIHAKLTAQLAVQGTPIGVADSWIAASALEHRHSIATRNLREFQRVEGLHVERW
jgi:tRNA(fMet)-specific endonuclease VapC